MVLMHCAPRTLQYYPQRLRAGEADGISPCGGQVFPQQCCIVVFDGSTIVAPPRTPRVLRLPLSHSTFLLHHSPPLSLQPSPPLTVYLSIDSHLLLPMPSLPLLYTSITFEIFACTDGPAIPSHCPLRPSARSTPSARMRRTIPTRILLYQVYLPDIPCPFSFYGTRQRASAVGATHTPAPCLQVAAGCRREE